VSRILGGVALWLAISGASRADVWVVDSAGGADFASLDEAVQAAADGDVLLVRFGLGPDANLWLAPIDGKSLTLVADGPLVYVRARVEIRNLAPDQHVTLRGFDFWYGSQLDLVDNDGVVWIEDSIVRADLYGGSGPLGAVHAVRSRLVVKDSVLSGSMQYGFYAAPPTSGLYLVDSTAVLHGASVQGGEGLDTIYPDLPGATGAVLVGSTLIASGSAVHGGLSIAEAGGAGLVASAGSGVLLRDTPVLGGSGVPPGAAMSLDASSTSAVLPGAADGLETTPAPREGGMLDVSVEGEPGDLVLLLVGFAPALEAAILAPSVLLVSPAPPAWSQSIGVLPGSGALGAAYLVPELGPLAGVELFLQTLHVDAAPLAARLGAGSVVQLLDAAF